MFTKNGLAVLRAIRDLASEHGHSPSFEEIGRTVGIGSRAGVKAVVDILEDAGLVAREHFKPRTLRLTDAGVRILEEEEAKKCNA